MNKADSIADWQRMFNSLTDPDEIEKNERIAKQAAYKNERMADTGAYV